MLSGLGDFLGICAAQLGDDQVLRGEAASAHYGISTIGIRRRIAAAVRPANREDVRAVVEASRRYTVPLYPISTGRNWGYGSANPVVDDCVVVDLSRMNTIHEVNPRTGVAVLEPGVTQAQLREYLNREGLDFLCPVTGAGPTCSILGNALERGYGITPHTDHFLAVMSLEAVLPDGRIYRPPLREAGCADADNGYKWGIGPFLDGIFSQGAFGIVTQITVALAPTPERVEGFFFGVPEDEKLEATVAAVQDILKELGPLVGGINIMNARRVVSMMQPYPHNAVGDTGILPQDTIEKLARAHRVMPWMGAGALYGSSTLVRAAKKIIRRRLGGSTARLMFFTSRSMGRLHRASRYLPFAPARNIENLFGTLHRTLTLLDGAPSGIALPLAYWIAGRTPDTVETMNPARDGCGLLWYSPLVPMEPDRVRGYASMVDRVCAAHRIEPLITMTSLSERCFDSTVPLLFDPDAPGAPERARTCYEALVHEGRKFGCTPYRAPISAMDLFVQPESPYWQLVESLKDAIDPERLMAPGRYGAT